MSYQTIKIERIDTVVVAKVLERRIFLKIAETFRDELVKVIDQGQNHLIIELSEVAVMNSAGLGILILARDKMRRSNGNLILCGLTSTMEEIFNRTHLDSFFNIKKDLLAALEEMHAKITK
jgi:anti-anti-sigma factor